MEINLNKDSVTCGKNMKKPNIHETAISEEGYKVKMYLKNNGNFFQIGDKKPQQPINLSSKLEKPQQHTL